MHGIPTLNHKKCNARGVWDPVMWIEDHYHPLVGVSHFITYKTLWQASYFFLHVRMFVCEGGWVSVKLLLTLPASLSGRPESLSEDLPLVRLSREWQEVASYRASYGLSSSGPGASPEINSLTLSKSPVTQVKMYIGALTDTQSS